MSASFDDGPPPVPSPEEQLRPPGTALASVPAPGITALIGAVGAAIVASTHAHPHGPTLGPGAEAVGPDAIRPVPGARRFRPGTVSGFLFAPGIAATFGIAALFVFTLCGTWPDVGHAAAASLIYLGPVAMTGYATALVLALPVYLLCSEPMRSSLVVVVPLAGAISAAPWWCLSDLWRGDRSYDAVITAPFALGAVGGAAFWLIRRFSPVIDIEEDA